MSSESRDDGAEILRLPVPKDRELTIEPPANEVEPRDTSFEIELDEAPPPSPPVMVDASPDRHVTQRPIIPPHLRTKAGIAAATKQAVARNTYRAGYHLIRVPKYSFWGLVWAVWGLLKAIGRQARWAWLMESAELRHGRVREEDYEWWFKLHREGKITRSARIKVVAAALVGLVAGGVALWWFTPWWTWLIIGLAVWPVLASYGRPPDKPIISTAIVVPRHRRLNADIVLRAYYSAGLGHPEKPGMQIEFGSTMARDALNTGSQVLVRVPYGIPFSEVVRAKEKLASGLDVSMSQVYLTQEKTSNRGHLLFVTDVDPLGIPAGKTPLLDCKPRDIWRPAPLGLDQRGQRVLIELVFYSILFGAQPRKGKSWTARSLALFAALDPYVRISVFDAKGAPTWRKFALIAHTYGFGLLADNIQGDPVDNLRITLRAMKREILERNVKLSEMPTSVCPEGKLTREIARSKQYKMPVWMLILDEFQEHLNTGDEEADREIAELLVFVIRVGPSVGIVIESATQRPSGIGSTGKIQKLFTDFRDNHLTRFALKTGSWQVSDLILGSGSYTDGFDSSVLPVGDEYRGIGILRESSAEDCTVRTYTADDQDAEKILLAARKLRERMGTLDGMAAGETLAAQARDPLADSLDAFHPGETWVSWAKLADRLAEQMPEGYAQVTRDGISATLRGLKLGIESRNGRDDSAPEGVAKGVHRAALERALERRSRDEAAR